MDGTVEILVGKKDSDCCDYCTRYTDCIGYVFDYIQKPGVCVLKNKICPTHETTGFYANSSSGVVLSRLAPSTLVTKPQGDIKQFMFLRDVISNIF